MSGEVTRGTFSLSLFCDYSVLNHPRNQVDAEPVRQLLMMRDVENDYVGSFPDLDASDFVTSVQGISSIDGSSIDCFGRRHLQLATGQSDYHLHRKRGTASGVEIGSQSDGNSGLNELSGRRIFVGH